MPSSVRWLGLLVGAALAAAVLSGAGIYYEARARTRIMAEAMTGGNAEAGEAALARYDCGACHKIEGIDGAAGAVGPSLDGVAIRAEIAGRLPNTPQQMIRWLEHPQRIAPGDGMPEQGVTEQDARDMSAYLYTLK